MQFLGVCVLLWCRRRVDTCPGASHCVRLKELRQAEPGDVEICKPAARGSRFVTTRRGACLTPCASLFWLRVWSPGAAAELRRARTNVRLPWLADALSAHMTATRGLHAYRAKAPTSERPKLPPQCAEGLHDARRWQRAYADAGPAAAATSAARPWVCARCGGQATGRACRGGSSWRSFVAYKAKGLKGRVTPCTHRQRRALAALSARVGCWLCAPRPARAGTVRMRSGHTGELQRWSACLRAPARHRRTSGRRLRCATWGVCSRR
jgi:hypothetical protein